MKKIFAISMLLLAVLFSFSAVFADETEDIVNRVISTLLPQLEEQMHFYMDATATAIVNEINENLSSENVEIIVKGTPEPAISSGFVWGTWKPTPTYYSYQATFLGQDKNYMHYAHGVQFTVNWTIRNTGPLPWNKQFYFRYVQGQGSLDGDLYMLPYNVEIGDTITFSRSFECADEPAIYNSYWELVDDYGVVILDNIWVGWQVDDWRQ